MKNLTLTIGGITLAALGVIMAIANPEQNAYDDYATGKISGYLKEKVCPELPQILGDTLKNQCKNIADSGRALLKPGITQTSKRQNFLFFSIYTTDLSLPPILPNYHIETIGIFNNFITYQANKN
jgi:hypothetical protein